MCKTSWSFDRTSAARCENLRTAEIDNNEAKIVGRDDVVRC